MILDLQNGAFNPNSMEYLQLKMQQIQLQMHALQTPGYEGGMNAYQLHHHQQQQQQRPIQQSPESQSQQPPQQQRMPIQAGLKSLYYAANALFWSCHHSCALLHHVEPRCITLHYVAPHCATLHRIKSFIIYLITSYINCISSAISHQLNHVNYIMSCHIVSYCINHNQSYIISYLILSYHIIYHISYIIYHISYIIYIIYIISYIIS